MKRVNHGAQYEISVDSVPRTYGDQRDIAVASAQFLKGRKQGLRWHFLAAAVDRCVVILSPAPAGLFL
jgi:hypothetical protein